MNHGFKIILSFIKRFKFMEIYGNANLVEKSNRHPAVTFRKWRAMDHSAINHIKGVF